MFSDVQMAPPRRYSHMGKSKGNLPPQVMALSAMALHQAQAME
jgi:hypothetical protein